jgi:hypothetical protein
MKKEVIIKAVLADGRGVRAGADANKSKQA